MLIAQLLATIDATRAINSRMLGCASVRDDTVSEWANKWARTWFVL
jgi:hypothetical protein